jgi:hypothetical protein
MEFFTFQKSIKEMCCIISKIGCDTHINTYHSNNKFHQYIILLMNCLGPLHIYKRVDKWNHEPHPLFIIRNTFPTQLSSFIFSIIINSENTKILIQLENANKNPKRSLSFFFYFPCPIIVCFTLFIWVLLIRNLVLDNYTVGLGT